MASPHGTPGRPPAPKESTGVTNASPEQGQGPQAARPPHVFDIKNPCPSRSLQERHHSSSCHWQFKGSHTGINHHMSQLWAATTPGASVTSPSALSGAVHSTQHQGPSSAFPQCFSFSSAALFHRHSPHYSTRKDRGDNASRAKEEPLPPRRGTGSAKLH